MFKNIFSRMYVNDEVPHVKHIVYPVLMIAAGYKSIISYHWDGFGMLMIIIGVLLALVIMFGIAWRGPIEYWDKVNSAVITMLRVKDPSIWHVLGFKEVPTVTKIVETVYDETGQYPSYKMKEVEVSPAVLNRVANKVIMNKSIEFTQELYGHLVPNWRKFQAYMKKNGYIVPKNKKNVRNGYILNHKGVTLMYESADEMVKLTARKEENGTKE